MLDLKYISISNYTTRSGKTIPIELSYQTFGMALHDAPIVLVNHALTGNSNVCGDQGWWKELIGEDKCIDTNEYTILAFNIPGNGYQEGAHNVITNYKDIVAADIAAIFLLGLKQLQIESLYAVIGGSVGGGIAWEMAALAPNLISHLIPIASDWKSTDWLIANCFLQDQLLNHSTNPIEDARTHAMLCYRTPASFRLKFDRSTHQELGIFNVESWLLHHGDKLRKRFSLAAYKLINHVLKTIDITKGQSNFEEVVATISSHIHIISVDSDLFFTASENKETFERLKNVNLNASYYEINSIHGHDAFLIEFDQLTALLSPIFQIKTKKVA